MNNPDRNACRVVGFIITGASLIFDFGIFLSLIFGLLILFCPLIYLPISLLLRKFGHLVFKIAKTPFLVIIYITLFAPYGLCIGPIVKHKPHKYKTMLTQKEGFDSQG